MPTLINAYCTRRDLPPLEFAHELVGRRDLSDPELAEHLEGFAGYVASCRESLTATRCHVVGHVLRAQHHVRLSIHDSVRDAFGAWAKQALAVAFLPDGSVRDPAGAVLIRPDGSDPDPQARLPYSTNALNRKARSLKLLDTLGVKTPASLPPVVSEEEVDLRVPVDVGRRALALFVVSIQGELWTTPDPMPLSGLRARNPTAFLSLSPSERSFLKSGACDPQSTINMTWRYEALATLLWALGLLDALPLATELCEVPRVAQRVLAASDRLPAWPTLRPAAEILDALDLHLRLHWVTRNALLKGEAIPAALQPGVIAERHHALNWLVRFGNADWDEVSTPT